MKFTDGFWNMRPGFTPHYAAQVQDVETTSRSLTVYASTRRLAQRGDTINTALLTVRFSSPLADVIHVQITHHQGMRPKKPGFALQPLPEPDVVIREEAESASLSSGQVSVRVNKSGDWQVDYLAADSLVTSSGRQALGFVDTPEGRFIHEQLSLGVGECVYGLGERFTALVKNGQVVEIWNQDGGTSSEQAYKNIPFYLTNRGYGVLVNHPELVSFEVASEKVERVQFSVAGESLEYFLIYGPSPKEVLEKYTALTGRPALPPAWSFGLWLSTSFTTNYDEASVTAMIEGMAERDIPLRVFHFDCFWMKEFNWCDFRWDARTFPDPPAMLQRLKGRGLNICVWINPYIAQRSLLFAEGAKNGYLLKKANGDIWQTDLWQAGMGIVDFTNPAARRWFGEKLRALLGMGVDCFKTDFGERIPTDVVYFDGSDAQRMHNYYSFLYNQTVFEVLEEWRGVNEAVVFARSGTAGGQQFPVHWGGDSTATFESMAETLRGGLSLSLSGFSFWSHDIGGFEQTATPAVYKRWCAFGLLSSHSRLHGSSSYRVPWSFDEEAVAVLRQFSKLKCRLMPYLFEAARQAQLSGIPVLRPMPLEFPDDPACDYLERQYILGPGLLVAPVFSADGLVSFYVPAGRWTSLLNNQEVRGPGWVQEKHDFLSLPLLVRPNTLLPLGAQESRPDYDYSAGVRLQVYALDPGAETSVSIPSLSGSVETIFTARREGQTVTIQRQGTAKPWRVLLVNVHDITRVSGGALEDTPQGVLISVEADQDSLWADLG